MSSKLVRPDRKGHKPILEPYVEMPASERWLFDDKTARTKVKHGLEDAAAGRLNDIGSFAKYADDETK